MDKLTKITDIATRFAELISNNNDKIEIKKCNNITKHKSEIELIKEIRNDKDYFNDNTVLVHIIKNAHLLTSTTIKSSTFRGLMQKFLKKFTLTQNMMSDVYHISIMCFDILISLNKTILSKTFLHFINIQEGTERKILAPGCLQCRSHSLCRTCFIKDTLKIIEFGKLKYSKSYLSSCFLLTKLYVTREPENDYLFDFFKNTLDSFFGEKPDNDTVHGSLSKFLKYYFDDNQSIYYNLMKYIIDKNYYIFNTHDVLRKSKLTTKKIIEYIPYHLINLLIDNRVIFNKEHFHSIIQKSDIRNKICTIPNELLNLLDNNGIIIDYDDVLLCCEKNIIFPEQYINHIKFDERYHNLCVQKSTCFYKDTITGKIPYDIALLEDKCKHKTTVKDLKHIVKTFKIKPTQKCLENACNLNNSKAVINYLMSFDLVINKECVQNMLQTSHNDDINKIIQNFIDHN